MDRFELGIRISLIIAILLLILLNSICISKIIDMSNILTGMIYHMELSKNRPVWLRSEDMDEIARRVAYENGKE